MRLNLRRPLVIFDLETTGLDIVKDRIIQIAYIKVMPDGGEERKNIFVNPGRPIPKEVAELTHITDEMVEGAPEFKEIAKDIKAVFEGCDVAGFNSNHFDIPFLTEEMLRAQVDLNLSGSALIDVQTIYHKMEKRNLSAAYKFYVGRKMEEDLNAHLADNDTEATYRVLMGQLDMYSPERQEDKDRILPNDMDSLAKFCRVNDNVDFAGRIVWGFKKRADGQVEKDPEGNPVRIEVFNFGKYKGVPVSEVLRREPGYYAWIMNGDFTLDTKMTLERIRMREKARR